MLFSVVQSLVRTPQKAASKLELPPKKQESENRLSVTDLRWGRSRRAVTEASYRLVSTTVGNHMGIPGAKLKFVFLFCVDPRVVEGCTHVTN